MNLSSIWSRLGSKGAKGGLVLVVGTVIGQLVTFGVTPFLARLYSDEDFGYLSLVVSAMSVVAPAAALKLDSALMLPTSKRDVSALFFTGLASSLAVSALFVAVLEAIFAAGWLANMASLPGFSLWVAVVAFLTAGFTLLSQVALRGHQFAAVAKRSIYQAVLAAAIQLGWGFASPGATGLIGGYSAGRVFGIIPLASAAKKEFTGFALADVRRLLKQYWQFPALFTPSAILNSAGLVAPVIFVGVWFSVAEAGQWAMADRIIAAPLVLVATAAAQVIEAQVSAMLRENRGNLVRYYLSLSAALTAVAAVVVALVVFVIPLVLPGILGAGWELAGQLMIAMTPIVAVRLIVNPSSRVLLLLQQGAWTLGLDILRVGLVGAVMVWTVVGALNLITAAWLFSAAMSIVYAVTWFVGLTAARRSSLPGERH